MSVALDRNGAARRGYVARAPHRAVRARERRVVWYLRRLHLRLRGRTLVLSGKRAAELTGALVLVVLAAWSGSTTGYAWFWAN